MQDAELNQAQAEIHDEPDMLFGVFHSVGEDLGIDPFLLRVAFLGGLLLSPLAMIAAYAALGAAVALSRWLFPKPKAPAEPAAEAIAAATEPQAARSAEDRERELIAA